MEMSQRLEMKNDSNVMNSPLLRYKRVVDEKNPIYGVLVGLVFLKVASRATASLSSLFRRFWASPVLSNPGDPHHNFYKVNFRRQPTKNLDCNYCDQDFENQVKLQDHTRIVKKTGRVIRIKRT